MRYLFAPVGTEGDIRPCIALAMRLREAGHEIKFATSPDFKEICSEYSIPFIEAGVDMKKFMSRSGMLNGKPLSTIKELLAMYDSIVKTLVDGILSCADSTDRIIGSGIVYAESIASEKTGIPYDHIVHVPAAIPSAYYPPLTITIQELPAWFNRALWKISEVGIGSVFGPIFNKYRIMNGLPRLRNLSSLLYSNTIVAMDKELAPLPPDVKGNVRSTGYFPLCESSELPADLQNFLDRCNPVYIGFGSMILDKNQQILSIIRKASKISGVPVILGSGWTKLGNENNNNDDNLFIVNRVPHHKLFTRVAAAIHHGGAGTTYSAARAGIPQCALPHMVDQFYWAHRIAKIGLGPHVKSKCLKKTEAFADMLIDIKNNNFYRSAADKLSIDLMKRDGVGEAVRLINSYD